MFAIHAMQWPGSIPHVLFVGVPLLAAMAWVNSAQICIRGPLELRRTIKNKLCALLYMNSGPPRIIPEFPPLRSIGLNKSHTFCLIPPQSCEAIAQINSARVFERGVLHAKYTHTHVHESYT